MAANRSNLRLDFNNNPVHRRTQSVRWYVGEPQIIPIDLSERTRLLPATPPPAYAPRLPPRNVRTAPPEVPPREIEVRPEPTIFDMFRELR